MPAELRSLGLHRPEVLYHLMLRESAAALQDLIATRYGGAKGGFTSVLHTWGRQIQHHPHVHLIVPAIAIHPETGRIARPAKDDFLVHFRPLAARFRSRMHAALRRDHPEIWHLLSPDQRHALSPRKTWNAQLQPVGRGKTALRYLARYVCRSAFSAKRLLGYDAAGNVRLAWTDSTTGKTGVLTLHPHEFIHRWLIHVLPKGFPRVRHYGFQSPAARKTRLLVRALLGEIGEPAAVLPEIEPFACPHCGGPLTYLRDIAPIRIPRGPPIRTTVRP
ncbi:IS91 family transposase ISSde12 [Haloferula sargassicola]|uniref:IS91 family transposase ISSde12 n=1 Tax=Haloferula sargassicola TaxID=490096 RepID=A0ABP9UUE2_9BACT